jgi:glycosyltransferase involved in cell wall biosynthesis
MAKCIGSMSAGIPIHSHRISACFAGHAGGSGHYQACLSICNGLQDPKLAVELHVPTSDPSGRAPFTRDAVPAWLKGLVYRLDRSGRLAQRILRRRYVASLAGANAAYLWAATPEDIYRDVKRSGVPLYVERINCHRATSMRILDDVYRRAGLPPAHGITLESLEEERRKLAMADRIFAPSTPVLRSLLDDGIPEEKVLLASYGWSPERVGTAARSRPADAPPVFLFAGTVCLRKGAHLLLEAWSAAGVNGRLDLVGQVLEEVRAVSGPRLERPDVNRTGYIPRVAQAFADSDVFAFPTLEEGSPLVIYEAMSFGLPILTSPMGAGEVVRDGVEGRVLDPFDRDAWVHELRRFASDPALRARMGDAARARALDFTWDKVASRRRDLFRSSLPSVASAAR